ncbi:MAG: family 43 glycosylhydrolase [Opitutales bacterium]|nr:family 43 glycosylhydrolase [Opitutales bacterium]
MDGYTYLATSTFSWLPGIPVYRSKDHRHWEALPHVIPDSHTLPFEESGVDAGLSAPGLCHDGQRFLLACTLVHRHTRRHHNFICTSEDPTQGS